MTETADPRTLEIVLALALGPLTGSFVGLVVERLPAHRPIGVDRSRCDLCNRTLTLVDLIPLLTYAARRGYCGCGKLRLLRFYPAIELAALAVALSALPVFSGWLLWASLGLGCWLLALAVIDQRHVLLPDRLTLPLIPIGLAVTALLAPERLPHHLLGAVLGYAASMAVAFAYRRLRGREGLREGDAKLLAAAGAWLGWQALPSVVLLAAVLGLAAASVARARGAKLDAASRIALGPWLALAFWLIWLLGPLVLA